MPHLRKIGIAVLTLVLCAILPAHRAVAQRSWVAVCPLSEQQTKASVSAFGKIVPTLTTEPRCVNCHGGLDFNDADKHDRVTLPTENDPGTQCIECHDNMVNRTNGQPSTWHLAPGFMHFVNKTERQLCEQIKGGAEGPCANGTCDPWPLAEKFIGHMTDDEGRDNFTATAFAGTRGLTGFPPIVPSITHRQLLALSHAWVDTTGGEWQGSRDCGCEPLHYALRVSAVTEITGSTFRNDMGPIDIPIRFADDGTFSGDSAVQMRGSDNDDYQCIAQSSAKTRLVVSGKAVQTWRERYLEVTIKSGAPTTADASVRCPDQSAARSFSGQSNEVWKVRLEGTVSEVARFAVPTPDPAVRTTARVEIVKLER
jgi:hypothetical protein